MQEPDGAEVDARVSIEDVAELVRDDALQLVAAEELKSAVRHADDGVARGVSCRKGVDAGLPVEHVHLGNGHPGRDRHLLDDVQQAALLELRRIGVHLAPTEAQRDRGAAVAQLGHLVERAQADHGRRAAEGKEQTPGFQNDRASWPTLS